MSKKYKCYYCEKRLIRKDLITHIEKTHQELIPQGYTASRLVYNQVNKVDQGKCRVCGKPTTWNEKSGRYNVLCDSPKCKEHMREEYKKNMLRVRGTYNILNDPEQQKIMLANRSISGTYKFSDGGTLTYTGSYEKKCLEFMDIVMQIPSKDILSPGPTLEYIYNGQKHFYITDFYYIPYNLIIEVKDGGDNLNTKDSASMKASREKTIEKEHIITDRGEYNYIRLTNNNFAQLIEVFMEIKQKLIEGDNSKTYKINESSMVLESLFTKMLKGDDRSKYENATKQVIPQPIDKPFDKISLYNDNIDIFVKNGKQFKVNVFAKTQKDISLISIDTVTKNNTLYLNVFSKNNPKVYIVVTTPSLNKLTIKNDNGGVNITSIIANEIYIRSENGDIYADKINAKLCRLITDNGDILVKIPDDKYTISKKSTNGDIYCDIRSLPSSSRRISCISVNGDINISNKGE